MRLLEGQVMPENDDTDIDDLREENRQLRDDLRASQRELQTAKRESARALGELRRLLGPFYKAFQMVFGELDAAGVDEAPAASGTANPRITAVWQNWKQKMGGQAAQIIDALLLHDKMTAQQIAIAIGIHKKNVPQLIFKLNKAGLIDKNGGVFSLKQL